MARSRKEFSLERFWFTFLFCFIDPEVLGGTNYTVCKAMILEVENGHQKVCDTGGNVWSLQDQNRKGDFRLFHISGYYMILGMDGLSKKLGPMQVDWSRMWVAFALIIPKSISLTPGPWSYAKRPLSFESLTPRY